VDDEQLARTLLKQYVDKSPQLELVAECKSPLEAMEFLRNTKIDLMFLDIQMPDLLGTEMLKVIPNKPLVIFTTAYKEYALEGFELDVVDYMLKPISFERFIQGVNKVEKRILSQNTPTETPAISNKKDYITLKSEHKIYKVKHDDILYIQGLKEYVTFFTTDQKIITLESLKKLENLLPSDKFLRVHKSYIINKDKVSALSGNELEITKVKIPIGKTYKEVVLEKVFL